MKFMMNGAITLGTLDGANVEIRNLVGDDNIMIFGMNADEAANFERYGGYSAQGVVDFDKRVKKITSQLVDGFFDRSGKKFWGIYEALLRSNDQFFVLKDFDAYIKAFTELDKIYDDKLHWSNMSLVNIAKSAYFSSDRTVKDYARDIWQIPCK